MVRGLHSNTQSGWQDTGSEVNGNDENGLEDNVNPDHS